MDSFTEKILIRARERQRLLGEICGKPNLESINKCTVSEPVLNETLMAKTPLKEVSSEDNISWKTKDETDTSSHGLEQQQNKDNRQQKTVNYTRGSFDMEIKVKSSDNIQFQVQIEEHDENEEEIPKNCGGGSGLREESKNRLMRLGKLYGSGEDANISSPIHRTEAKFYRNDDDDDSNGKKIEDTKKNETNKCSKGGLRKLADLANTISQWEDDLSHPRPISNTNSPKKQWKPPVQQQLEETVTSKVTSHKNVPQQTPAKTVESKTKQVNWDQKVLDSLESQGFTRRKSSSNLIYYYPSDKADNQKEPESQSVSVEKLKNVPLDTKKPFKTGGVASRAAIFEQKKLESAKAAKDPALLSLAERKALFEKNKGEALVPKAAFGMSAAVKVDTTMKACESKFIGAHKNAVTAVKTTTKVNNEQQGNHQSKLKQNDSDIKPIPPPAQTVTKTAVVQATKALVHQATGGVTSRMISLLENQKQTISEEQISKKVKEERAKEMEMLLNRYKQISNEQNAIHEISNNNSDDDDEDDCNEETRILREKPASIVQQQPERRKSAEKRKSTESRISESDSSYVITVLEDVKRIKVSPPKAGRLYPNLSDIEATASEADTRASSPNHDDEENSFADNSCDSSDPNTSFGRDILQNVCKNMTPTKNNVHFYGVSSSENSSLGPELDEILEEMDDEDSSSIGGPTPPKHGRKQQTKRSKPEQSHSFHYQSFTSPPPSSLSQKKQSNFQSPSKDVITPRQSIDLPLVVDGDEVLQLTHTVSFYRKQQNEAHTPSNHSKKPQHFTIAEEEPSVEDAENESNVEKIKVAEKIKELEEEVNLQQNIISQTSQALNLCSSTPEFSGSTEQVEAEKVLLLATHRRQAALHELQRLKVEKCLRPLSKHSQNIPLEKGTLTISNIMLPLKEKYVKALDAAGGKGHHVVCLVKCGEQVVSTKLVSTVASKSKNRDVTLNIPGSVVLNNIYSDFAATFEVYCLQAQEEFLPHEVKYHINKKGSKILTPKKSKHDSRLVMPPKESPAGPQAVRTSSFALMGFVTFSVQSVNKKVWCLNNTPSMSPLEGNVHIEIHCELAVSVEHRGFLTMFEDISGFGAWHRRWCLLKGGTLSYWKYPDDEKKMAPKNQIDLTNCTTKVVGPVDRDICARLNTFLLESERESYPTDKDTLVIIKKGNRTLIRHLLSADTKQERIEWCNKLNAALTALRMWGENSQH